MTVERQNFVRPLNEIFGSLAGWVCAIPQLKVFWSIVVTLAVLVMDSFRWQQRATDNALHDMSVLMPPFVARDFNDYIAFLVDALGANRNQSTQSGYSRSARCGVRPNVGHKILWSGPHHAISALRVGPSPFHGSRDTRFQLRVPLVTTRSGHPQSCAIFWPRCDFAHAFGVLRSLFCRPLAAFSFSHVSMVTHAAVFGSGL